MKLKQIKNIVTEKLADYRAAQASFKREKKELKKILKLHKQLEEAQKIVQQVSQTIQQQAHSQIAGVVSKCLQMVFGKEYDFKIKFERKRSKTEAKLLLLKKGHEVEDAIDEDSGGIVEVAAFALRVACLILSKPALRKVLILDEPFKCVSRNHLDKVRYMLEGLSKDFKIQFIIITHIKKLETGKVVRL